MTDFLRDAVDIINYVFLFYVTAYTVFLFAAAIFGAVATDKRARLESYRANLSLQNMTNYFPISVLVPAYNEELTILDAVLSLSRLDYPEYEIIIIDDGSTDNTAEILIRELHLKKSERPIRRRVPCGAFKSLYESEGIAPHIILVRKENGGKSDALNMGINISRYPYFLTMDADSVMQKDALQKIIMPIIADSRVIAVGGMVQVANETVIEDGEIKDYKFPTNSLVLLQVLDYSRIFMGTRMLLDAFNGNLIISGACGLFRKDIAIQTNGYATDIVGEDMELVVKLHAYCRSRRIPYRIVYAPDAVCWTQVPTRLRDLRIQRRRWHIGLIQSIQLHKGALLNPQYGTMGMISMVYYLLMEAIEPIIELLGLTAILLASTLHMLNIHFMVWYFVLFFMLSVLLTITSFFLRSYTAHARLSVGQALKAIIFAFVECLGFHQLMGLYRISAFVGYRKNKSQWGTIQRTTHNRRKGQDQYAGKPTAG